MKEVLSLVFPHIDLQDSYRALKKEFEFLGEPLIPFPLSFPCDDFKKFLKLMKCQSEGVGISEGFVANTTYWLVYDNIDVIGVSNLRHSLTPELEREGGHIGYGIRPSFRGRGFGNEILRLTLRKAKDRGLKKVLITCGKSNTRSAAVILRNQGVFAAEEFLEERKDFVQKFWIDIASLS